VCEGRGVVDVVDGKPGGPLGVCGAETGTGEEGGEVVEAEGDVLVVVPV
jgi:hypothetical protein